LSVGRRKKAFNPSQARLKKPVLRVPNRIRTCSTIPFVSR